MNLGLRHLLNSKPSKSTAFPYHRAQYQHKCYISSIKAISPLVRKKSIFKDFIWARLIRVSPFDIPVLGTKETLKQENMKLLDDLSSCVTHKT